MNRTKITPAQLEHLLVTQPERFTKPAFVVSVMLVLSWKLRWFAYAVWAWVAYRAILTIAAQ